MNEQTRVNIITTRMSFNKHICLQQFLKGYHTSLLGTQFCGQINR